MKTLTMKICTACSKKNLEDANFCMGCGASLAAPEPVFGHSDMAKALVDLIKDEHLMAWGDDGQMLYIAPRNQPESLAIATRGKRNPSSLTITAPVGVFHGGLSKEWDLENGPFTIAEMSILYDFYSSYYDEDPELAQEFSSKVLTEDHMYYIAIANQLLLDGGKVSAYDGSNPESIIEGIGIIRAAFERKPKSEREIFKALTGVKKWNMERSWFSNGQSEVFAGIPGSSNKGKKMPTKGYIPLADGWNPLLLSYTFDFSPVEDSTLAVLRTIFEIRNIWFPSLAKLTNSCNGYIAPFSALPDPVAPQG